MIQFTLAFLCGDLFVQCFSFLPGKIVAWLILIAALTIFLIKKIPLRYRSWLGAFFLGLAWTLFYANAIASFSLPTLWEGKTLQVSGTITSIPKVSAFQTAFIFTSDKLSYNNATLTHPTKLAISWRNLKTLLQVGDQWQLPLRLKKIHGNSNPGGFDYEAYTFQNGIRAQGYVVEKEKPVFIASHWYHQPINRLRQTIQQRAQLLLPASNTSPWLMALMVGERSGISKEGWEVLRRTGTNHLLAIAGLHIGFMSALIYAVTSFIWRYLPRLALRIPAMQVGALASLSIAVIYSALAGFSIPTQRAVIMIAVFLSSSLSRRKIPAWQSWSLALLIVLVVNPLSVLSASFWLSFTTLALIIYGVGGRLSPRGWWWKHGRLQWVICIGLLPLSLWFFGEYSLVAFFANAIAIPWVGFLILPLCLLSVIFLLVAPAGAKITLALADKSLSFLWKILLWFAHLSW